jgi:hypothetical protein
MLVFSLSHPSEEDALVARFPCCLFCSPHSTGFILFVTAFLACAGPLFDAMPAAEAVEVSEKENVDEGDEGVGDEEEENNMNREDSKEANLARCARRCGDL